MPRQSWLYRICVVSAVAAGSCLICAVIGVKLERTPWFSAFFAATIVAVLLVCVANELVLPRPVQNDAWARLVAPALRGAFVGLCMASAILYLISAMINTGDKFPAFVLVFIPLAT